jgi:hypothetical protein
MSSLSSSPEDSAQRDAVRLLVGLLAVGEILHVHPTASSDRRGFRV